MIEVVEKVHMHSDTTPEVNHTIILDYDQRTKGRLRTVTVNGVDAGLFLERGKVLRNGDLLATKDGELVAVQAANESLIEARCDEWLTFAKCCYHLGNRHVPIQVGDLFLRMRPDYILEDMLVQLGMSASKITAPFDPEQGAYSGGHHHH